MCREKRLRCCSMPNLWQNQSGEQESWHGSQSIIKGDGCWLMDIHGSNLNIMMKAFQNWAQKLKQMSHDPSKDRGCGKSFHCAYYKKPLQWRQVKTTPPCCCWAWWHGRLVWNLHFHAGRLCIREMFSQLSHESNIFYSFYHKRHIMYLSEVAGAFKFIWDQFHCK